MKSKRACHFIVEPHHYPYNKARTVPAAGRDALNNEIQFTALRTFTQGPDGSLLEPRKELELYTERFRLGNVIWPVYPTLFAPNVKEMIDAVAEKGLYLFDIWGYVPGASPAPNNIWGEYKIPEEIDAYLKSRLGDHFLGYDNGEQDGRYIGQYTSRLPLAEPSRIAQHERFHRHFTALWDAMRHHTVVLASLMYLHYFAKEGNATLLGAETGQALPCANTWFSFIRGAARQYGYLYFGNASIWNRWGYKSYASEGKCESFAWGPHEGTSLSLLRRLLYTEYVYGADILGFEQSWINGFDTEMAISGKETALTDKIALAELSPVGKIQRHAVDFARREGRPGAYYAPLAILMDYHCGWNPPRHLYTSQIYKVWGDLPYEDGDYQAHALFTMLYPGYENAGFYRDERGFLTATPFGDIADVLLSDVAPEILRNYEACIVLSSIPSSLEMTDTLGCFLRSGGHILFFDGELAQAFLARYGIPGHKPGTWPAGGGKITLLSRGNGLVCSGESVSMDNRPDEPVAMPLDLVPDAKAALAKALDDLALIRPDSRSLQYSTALRREGNELVCLVANNNAEDIVFGFENAACRIKSCREIPIGDDVSGETGYLPDALIPAVRNQPALDDPGGGRYRIAAADVRLFALDISGSALAIREPEAPAERDGRLILRMPSSIRTIREYLLAHPTFGRHFAGLMVDARYMESVSDEQAAYEAAYLRRQGLRVIVDAVPLCNHYPDYTLSGSVEERRLATIRRLDRVLGIASRYGCGDIILSLTQRAEQNQTVEELRDSTESTLRDLSAQGREKGIRIHLLRTAETAGAAPRWDEWNDVASLSSEMEETGESIAGLLVSAPVIDRFGQFYPLQKPVAGSDLADRIADRLQSIPMRNLDFIVLAADYTDWDEVFADYRWYIAAVRI